MEKGSITPEERMREQIALRTDDPEVRVIAERLAQVPHLNFHGNTYEGLVQMAQKLQEGKEIVLNPQFEVAPGPERA